MNKMLIIHVLPIYWVVLTLISMLACNSTKISCNVQFGFAVPFVETSLRFKMTDETEMWIKHSN